MDIYFELFSNVMYFVDGGVTNFFVFVLFFVQANKYISRVCM